MNQRCHLPGERLVGNPGVWLGFVLAGQFFHLVSTEKCEVLEIANHVPIIDPNPKLVKLIDARAVDVEPDGAALGLAELGPVSVGDERSVKPYACRFCLR